MNTIRFRKTCPKCKVNFLWESIVGLIMVIQDNCYKAKCPKCSAEYKVRKT